MSSLKFDKKNAAANRRLAQWGVMWCIDSLYAEIHDYAKRLNVIGKARQIITCRWNDREEGHICYSGKCE